LIDLFLDNKKVDLRYCDELGDNIVDYAQENTYGLRQEIVDRVEEIDDGVIKEYNVLKLANCEMQHIPSWKSLICDLQDYFDNGSSWLQPLGFSFNCSFATNEKLQMESILRAIF
jgi:hypothetical protein